MTSRDSIIIGVDGGGTACKAALCVGPGMTRYERRGGPANVSDFAPAIGVIHGVIAALVGEAGLQPADLARTCVHLGLAGVTGPVMAERVAGALRTVLPIGKIAVTGDQPTMVAGALGARDGVVAAIGTGSFIARQKDMALRTLGGWGFRLGDQASGAWLGQRLLQEVMLVHDGVMPATGLSRAVMGRFHDDPAEVVAFAIAARPSDFADFAPQVLDAAAGSDALAVRLMRDGAAYIVMSLAALEWRDADAVCLTGGVGPYYASWLPERTVQALTAPLGDALDGALLLASRLSRREGAL